MIATLASSYSFEPKYKGSIADLVAMDCIRKRRVSSIESK